MSEGCVSVARSLRGGWTENVHFGVGAVATPAGRVVAGAGDPTRRVYLRSAAKPIQLLPLVGAGGVAANGLSSAEIALMCSSHEGSDTHVAAIRSLLSRVRLSEDDLGCGIHPPLSAAAARALRERGESAGNAHNNCSANHIGQLLACRALQLPLDGYRDPAHPLQRRVLELVAEFAGVEHDGVQIGSTLR